MFTVIYLSRLISIASIQRNLQVLRIVHEEGMHPHLVEGTPSFSMILKLGSWTISISDSQIKHGLRLENLIGLHTKMLFQYNCLEALQLHNKSLIINNY